MPRTRRRASAPPSTPSRSCATSAHRLLRRQPRGLATRRSRLQGQPKSYLDPREYFNRDWTLFYSAGRIARELQAAKSHVCRVGHADREPSQRADGTAGRRSSSPSSRHANARSCLERLRHQPALSAATSSPSRSQPPPPRPTASSSARRHRPVQTGAGRRLPDRPRPASSSSTISSSARSSSRADGRCFWRNSPSAPPQGVAEDRETREGGTHTLLAAGQAVVFAPPDRRPALPPGSPALRLCRLRFNRALCRRRLGQSAARHPRLPVAGTG